MKSILVSPPHVRAIAAACTALVGTEHEIAMLELLRSASPFHPLLWRYAEIARDMETMREVVS